MNTFDLLQAKPKLGGRTTLLRMINDITRMGPRKGRSTVLGIAMLLFTGPGVLACSPWSPLSGGGIVLGNELHISLNSHTGWQCCYTARIELRCVSQSFTGTHTHSTNQICKGGGGNNFGSWTTAAFPFNLLVIDLSAYCPGEELKWRAREQGPDGFGPYTPTYTFTVPGAPIPLVATVEGAPLSVCPGDCATLTASSVGGCGTMTYAWSQGAVGASVSVCPTESTTYVVTATANSLCGATQSNTASITVNVDLAPEEGTATIFPSSVCLGESTTLTLADFDGDIQWQSSADAGGPWVDIPGANQPVHTYGPIGIATFFRAMVSNTACAPVLSNVIDVEIEPVPAVNFLAPMVCANTPSVLTDQSDEPGMIVSWDWDLGDGNSSAVQNPVHQYASAGTYSTTLTVAFDNGCVGAFTQNVLVMPMPVPDFTSILACANVDTEINDLSVVAAPSVITDWAWDVDNDGSVEYTTQNVAHTYWTGGVYQVALEVTTNSGCTASITLPVPVTPAPTAIYAASTVCERAATVFTDQSEGTVADWSWNFGDGNAATNQHPVHTYATAGVYEATLTVTNSNDCPSTTTQSVTVWPTPVASMISTDPEGCSPVCINFTSTSITDGGGITSTQWTFGDGSVSDEQNPYRCFPNDHPTNDISHDLQLVVVNDLGCRDTLQIGDYIQVFHNPLSAFTATPTSTHMYAPEILLTNHSIGGDVHHWDMGDQETSLEYEFIHVYSDTGSYTITLTVSTVNGCIDISTVDVVILPIVNLYVPNAFTPDGDGLNDTFFFTGYGILERDLEFLIFDRWGEVIFSTNKFLAWDGTLNGTPVKDGVYVYSIKYRDTLGGIHLKRGHVTLLR